MYYNPVSLYFILSSFATVTARHLPLVPHVSRQSALAEDVFMVVGDVPDDPLGPLITSDRPIGYLNSTWPQDCEPEQAGRQTLPTLKECLQYCNDVLDKECTFVAFGRDKSQNDNFCFAYHLFQKDCILRQCGTAGSNCQNANDYQTVYFGGKYYLSQGRQTMTGDSLMLDDLEYGFDMITFQTCRGACSLHPDCNAFTFDYTINKCKIMAKYTVDDSAFTACDNCISYITGEVEYRSWKTAQFVPPGPFRIIGSYEPYTCPTYSDQAYGKHQIVKTNVQSTKECADYCSETLHGRCTYAILHPDGTCMPFFDPTYKCRLKRSPDPGTKLISFSSTQLADAGNIEIGGGVVGELKVRELSNKLVSRGRIGRGAEECKMLCEFYPFCTAATWKETSEGFPVGCDLRIYTGDDKSQPKLPCEGPRGLYKCQTYVRPDLLVRSNV